MKKNSWDELNKDPGLIQIMEKSASWKRKLFNGYAQIIIQNDGSGENVVVEAFSDHLEPGKLMIKKKKDKL